jgi:hypothetical protein
MSFGSKRTIGLVGCANVGTVAKTAAKTTQWCGLAGMWSRADGILCEVRCSDMPPYSEQST